MKAFVTDGEQRPALAIVRSLARSGVTVLVGADRPGCLAFASRYCAGRVTYPSPLDDKDAFARFLLDFLARERVDVVVPVTDITTHAVCANKDGIGRLSAVAVPGLRAFEAVSDKSLLLQRAVRAAVPVPRTDYVEGLAGLRAVVDNIRYPAVVKPVRSRIRTPTGWLPASVHYARSKSELLTLYAENKYLSSHPSLIQQRIVGPGCGVFLLLDHGVAVAEFAHRRVREKPPSGGASVLCESVPMDRRLRRHALRILGPLGWHGVAMVEFKQDRATGEFYLMEVNGRFWGSLQLAIDAGVDFPRLACDLALGHRPLSPPPYRSGVRSRWFFGDLDHLMLRLFKSDDELCLDDSAPTRWQAVYEFMRLSGRNLHYDVIDARDPGPFLHECRENLRLLTASAGSSIHHRLTRTRLVPKSRLAQSDVPAAGH